MTINEDCKQAIKVIIDKLGTVDIMISIEVTSTEPPKIRVYNAKGNAIHVQGKVPQTISSEHMFGTSTTIYKLPIDVNKLVRNK